MIFRLICGIIIITGFTYCGYLYSEKQKDRLRQLSAFCDGLTMLEFNVRYMNFPMAEALFQASENCEGVAKRIFKRTSNLLEADLAFSPGEAFCTAVEESEGELLISSDEIGILKSFSRTMGEGDRETEISNIQAAKTRLSAAQSDAKEEVYRRAKTARGISTLAGLFIVILLF